MLRNFYWANQNDDYEEALGEFKVAEKTMDTILSGYDQITRGEEDRRVNSEAFGEIGGEREGVFNQG